MIVVIRKTEKPQHPRAQGPRGHVAAILGLLVLAIAAGAWFWTTHQAPQANAGSILVQGVIVTACGASVAALIAALRTLTLTDVLEAVLSLVIGFFALIGAILRGICNAILGLLGWD